MTATPAPDPRPAPVSDWVLFFVKFLKQGRDIAALAPSSRWLARAVVAGIDWAGARCVVELGAGTGPITRELLAEADETTCRTIVIERDPDFCVRLREQFPKADIIQGDALDLSRVLAERGVTGVDHLISGLPLPSFPRQARDRLLDAVGTYLTPGGTFRQLTHMPWVYAPLYRSYFQEVEFRFVPLNLPPGGVYVCRGLKGRGEGSMAQY